MIVVAAIAFAAGPKRARTMRLEDVLTAAVTKAKVEDARLELARNTLSFLDTQNRLRVELRPNLNVFAFTNPALLATSLGGGLLFNRRTAPGFAAMDSARFDTLAAEVNAETLKVRVQLEAARAYFDLLERQQVVKISAEILVARREGAASIERLLKAARITDADKLAYEQELLDLELRSVDAEAERRSASSRLALLIGAEDPGADIAVEETEIRDSRQQVPELDRLFALALAHRGESRLLRGKAAALRGQSGAPKRATVEAASAGYGFVKNNAVGVSNVLENAILGGHSGRGDLSLTIPLRNIGEKAAHDAVTSARIRLLELEISAMEDSVRGEVAVLRDAAASTIDRQRLAERKLELARRSAEVVHARAENGLAPVSATAGADAGVLAAQSAYARAVCQRKAALYALMVACGVDEKSMPQATASNGE